MVQWLLMLKALGFVLSNSNNDTHTHTHTHTHTEMTNVAEDAGCQGCSFIPSALVNQCSYFVQYLPSFFSFLKILSLVSLDGLELAI